MKDEESIIRQKSRVQWLKLGDRNTKFFYNSLKNPLKIRRHRNQIRRLDIEGEQVTDQISGSIYLNIILSSSTVARPALLNGVEIGICRPSTTSKSKNCAVTREEIEVVIREANGDRAPGPDGFHAHFFKATWSIIGDEVTKAIPNFFQSGRLLREVNKAFIALIPKSQDACNIKDWRPISLCNCLYQILPQILANRLQAILPSLISLNPILLRGGESQMQSCLQTNS